MVSKGDTVTVVYTVNHGPNEGKRNQMGLTVTEVNSDGFVARSSSNKYRVVGSDLYGPNPPGSGNEEKIGTDVEVN
jgi:hypothetical protein